MTNLRLEGITFLICFRLFFVVVLRRLRYFCVHRKYLKPASTTHSVRGCLRGFPTMFVFANLDVESSVKLCHRKRWIEKGEAQSDATTPIFGSHMGIICPTPFFETLRILGMTCFEAPGFSLGGPGPCFHKLREVDIASEKKSRF